MRTDLSTLVKAIGLALAAAAAILFLGPALGFAVNAVPVILGCVALSVAASYLYVAGETADRVEWPAPPLPDELPQHPSEVRTRRLTQEVKGTLDRAPLASRELGRTLAGLVADRLVARHGADPDQPLADARAHLSAGFAAYLGASLTPDSTMPRVNRATLHAYLKEIEAL